MAPEKGSKGSAGETSESKVLSALGGFFGNDPAKKSIWIRKLESEILVCGKLKALGYSVESIANVGANRTPSIVLKGGVKIDVRTKNLKSPTGLRDFSIKKNGARVADAVICHNPLDGSFLIFSRSEVSEFWVDGEFYYSPDCLYFYNWTSKEEAEAFLGKTKKGRERAWGRLFSNKDRFSDWTNSVLGMKTDSFLKAWGKIREITPAEPEKKEKKELDVSDIVGN